MKMRLERGDKCPVRLRCGIVVEAIYDESFTDKTTKIHWIKIGSKFLVAGRRKQEDCVFQYPLAEMKRQMGLQ